MSSEFIGLTDEDLASQWCVVYERDTGAIVHIHQFVPTSAQDRWSTDELERVAREAAVRFHPGIALNILHPAEGTKLNPRLRYRVDPKSQSLLTEADLAPVEKTPPASR
jgi:hypothetical protein